jgi:hypothetical protein
MKRNRDPLALTQHWHVDCRVEAELPEDKIVGTRFLANVLFTAMAAGLLLFTGWLGYVGLSLRQQIRDWENRISDNRAAVREVQIMQRDFAAEAAKIDQAFALMRPRLRVSSFIANIGRSRPDQMAIDIIEWNEAGVVVRGSLAETSERATRMLGGYVEKLREDDGIGPLFREIVLTSLDRGGSGGSLRFEINFRLKPDNI